MPAGTDAREVIRAVSAPLYYRLLANGDQLDEDAADRAAHAAAAATCRGVPRLTEVIMDRDVVRIRSAEPADAEAIAVVHVRSWQAAYRGLIPQEYLDQLRPAERQPVWEDRLAETSWPRRGILVAEVDGRVVGFAGLVPYRDPGEDPETVGEIAAIYLAPEAWRSGIGRRLMAAALDTLARAGYEQVAVWVLDTNARARRFYEAAGFRRDGVVKVDEARGFPLTEVRYRRPLQPTD